MKKFNIVLLAAVLVLSMTVTAFADIEGPELGADEVIESVEGAVGGQEVVSEAELELPTIKVTIPTTQGFIVNPFNLEDAGQIVSTEATIKNESNVAVEVSLKSALAEIGATDPKQKAVLAAITAKTTAKTIELRLLVGAGTGATLETGLPVEGVLITGKEKDIKLAKLDIGDETASEVTIEYGGKVLANPAGNPWTAADTIKVTSIYSFVPVVIE